MDAGGLKQKSGAAGALKVFPGQVLDLVEARTGLWCHLTRRRPSPAPGLPEELDSPVYGLPSLGPHCGERWPECPCPPGTGEEGQAKQDKRLLHLCHSMSWNGYSEV